MSRMSILGGALVGVALSAGPAASPAGAVTVVVPGAFATAEGPSVGSVPRGSFRYQQVQAASEFAGTGPLWLTSMAWRADATSAAFDLTYADFRVDLSTTTTGPDLLSTTFADNVGADVVTVFSGPLRLTATAAGLASTPNAFDLVVQFQTPFLYDPTQGNLLFDLRTFAGASQAYTIDVVTVVGDSVSNIVIAGLNAANSSIGNEVLSLGHIVRFTGVSANATVPEPGSLAILGQAACLTALALRRRHRLRPHARRPKPQA